MRKYSTDVNLALEARYTVKTQPQHITGIIGSSPQMHEVTERVLQVAPTDLCVLITGESGTGKEVFARAVHNLSKRRRERMISLNCGAIPETLLESELFGSEKGAYTGAAEQRKGFFEAADKGTIFLDELGEMPLGTQVKLLRVLETGEFSRLGSPDIIRSDVRIIAATNRRLEEEVARGTFRQDLFYRLNAVQIEIPPLREHPDDIPELVEYFARRTTQKIGVEYKGMSAEALHVLKNLPWAGNVRELRNLIETVVTLEKGREITLDTLRPYMPRALKSPVSAGNAEYQVPMPQTLLAPSRTLPPSAPFVPDNSFQGNGFQDTVLRMLPFMAGERYDRAGYDGTEYNNKVLAQSSLMRIPAKTPEQLERELMYKALVDLVREVALLRGEVADLRDVVFTQKRDSDGHEISPVRVSSVTPVRDTQDAPEEPSYQSATLEESPLTMHEVEKRLIGAALGRFDGNRRQAADALGISERTLYRKLREYGLVDGASPPHED
ncbi:MAG: sigma 54-interacting transcriptional regulator [Ignavibacteria bacterium]|nr:sigma 54-interacting transcriptional regulator [Ignavibacteria bacterium]